MKREAVDEDLFGDQGGPDDGDDGGEKGKRSAGAARGGAAKLSRSKDPENVKCMREWLASALKPSMYITIRIKVEETLADETAESETLHPFQVLSLEKRNVVVSTYHSEARVAGAYDIVVQPLEVVREDLSIVSVES